MKKKERWLEKEQSNVDEITHSIVFFHQQICLLRFKFHEVALPKISTVVLQRFVFLRGFYIKVLGHGTPNLSSASYKDDLSYSGNEIRCF